MKRLSTSLIALLAAAPLAANAQETIPTLDEIVVTANRTETELSRTGISVAVLDESDLAATGQTTVAGALARLPGVSLTTQGSFGNQATVRVRGADGRYLAVFVDGIRVSDPSAVQTSFDFGALMLADIGRVEVLRGSQSALWGGSAVGGVINITTRAAIEEGRHQFVTAEAGSNGKALLSYGLTEKGAGYEISVNATRLHTDGYSSVATGTEADGGDSMRLSVNGSYRINDTLTLGGAVFTQETEHEYDGLNAAWAQVDESNIQTRRDIGARAFAELDMGRSVHTFDVSIFDTDRTLDEDPDQASDPRVITRFGGGRLGFGWKAETELNPTWTLVYGADTMKESADYDNLPDQSAGTRISGAFVQGLWAPTDTLDLAATLRSDRNSAFGSYTTGRVAAAWRPSESVTLRAAYATGFRAPSIDERFGSYPLQEFVGNPDLSPEESESFELGSEFALTGGASLTLTAFRLNIDNLVTYDACPYNGFTFGCQAGTISSLTNVAGQSTRQGLEMGASLPVSDRVTLGANYTYTDARSATGSRLGFVARHDLSVSLDAELTDRLAGQVVVNSVSPRLDSFYDVMLDRYATVDVTVRYAFAEETDLQLGVTNLTDDSYAPAFGYAGEERSIHVGLTHRF